MVALVALLLPPVVAACSVVTVESSSGTAAVPVPTDGASGGADGTDNGSGAAPVTGVDSVVMIGDSITRGAEPFLEERFELLGLEATIEAADGKRMVSSSGSNTSGAAVAESLVANGDGDHTDEIWVIALGTNDIGQYVTDTEIEAAVDEVLASVPDNVALVWVDTWIVGRPEQSGAVNATIRERVEQRGNSVVAPWSAVAEDDGVLTGDGVHPTTDGADVFAEVVTDTVARFLDR
jgi:lysophospholipase L1-like esterase